MNPHARKKLKGLTFLQVQYNVRYFLEQVLETVPFKSHTRPTPGEQIIKYYFKFLSRNCGYCEESLKVTARPAYRHSYCRAYGYI